MEFQPLNNEQKEQWINWLEAVKSTLNGKTEDAFENSVFQTAEGDVNTAKVLVGTFLATLTNSKSEIL